ncbi:endoglucanase family protein, putative [Babesia ovis]|uniref:Endoglucanase family protein, putative n=1 Tax=Babesia ovis TaxID=5869 RepID=A0A9W5WVB5_BABOV|nr:endoglucanase family protein, putative [Babesia ovis]
MGLDELSDVQRKLLHPLVRLKRKTSQESLGSFVEFIGDLSRLYHEFALGLQQLETRAEASCFITGLSNTNSLEALRQCRGDPSIPDETVAAITKEQKGMNAVWVALYNLVSRTRRETNDFTSRLSTSIQDPLNVFVDEFNEGFDEPVDELEMNDVLNLIPNLKILKQAPGFHHSGARKHVENVLKAYKELQHALENEKELVGDAIGVNCGKSQAKAVNKTVKAKISLGKHIQHLFDQAPEMKILITKGVSHETIEQLATYKFKKSPAIAEEPHTDPLDFHKRFSAMEKRRLSMFSSCFQVLVEALVKYDKNSYENLRDLYNAVLEFSPECDYGHYESLILGAQVSEIKTHSRMPDEIWLPKQLEELENFQAGKQSNASSVLQQPPEFRENDETATVMDDQSVMAPEDHEQEGHHVGFHKPLAIAVPRIVRAISNVISRVSSVTTEVKQTQDVAITSNNGTTTPQGHLDETSNGNHDVEDFTDSALTIGVMGSDQPYDLPNIGTINSPMNRSVSSPPGSVVCSPTAGSVHSDYDPKQETGGVSNSILDNDKLAPIHTNSITRHFESNVFGKSESPLISDVHKFYQPNRPSNRRGSSQLPCDVRHLSIPLLKGHKHKHNDSIKSNASNDSTNRNSKDAKVDNSASANMDTSPTTFIRQNVEYDSSHFSNNADKPFKHGLPFDFESLKTAREVLEKTLERSNAYFTQLHRTCGLGLQSGFNFALDGIEKLYEPDDYDDYPFEFTSLAGITPTVQVPTVSQHPVHKGLANFHWNKHIPVVNEAPCVDKEQNVLRLPYRLDNEFMDARQWNLLALESLLLLHKQLSRYLSHPCLSNNTDPVLREFLLTNLGVLENITVRVRNFIDIIRRRVSVDQQEFDVIDVLITPRDSFVNPTPNVRIHPMDIRYRLLLLIDSWKKNDIPLANERLFDLPEFAKFLHRQIFVIKLCITQKLARVIRKIPTLDTDLNKRWLEAINSENPMNILNLKFSFAEEAKVDRIANKIVLLLCECIGRLNVLQRVVEKHHWGEESVCDSNYMSTHDQLLQMLTITSQVEELDNDLVEMLSVPPKSMDESNLPRETISTPTPAKPPHELLSFTRTISARLLKRKNSSTPSTNSDLRGAPNILSSDADNHFCTSMAIFEDEDISVLRRVNNRKGCFNKCITRRNRRQTDLQPSYINPYFIQPLEETELSQCWRFEDCVLLRIAACYHDLFSDSLRFGDWPINFTTIEYIIYFMSTGRLTNFQLYKNQDANNDSSICTLFHVLLSMDGLSKMREAINASTKSRGSRASADLKSARKSVVDEHVAKDQFSMLQVPNNIALFPKVLGDIDVYLQVDVKGATCDPQSTKVTYTAPIYSSIQFSEYLDSETDDWRSVVKKNLAGIPLNRANYKIQRLILDSICHNMPMMSRVTKSDSLSLINGSSCEKLVTNLLLLRLLTQKFRTQVLNQLLNFDPEEGETNLAFKLSLFVMLDRLLYQDDLGATVSDAGPLDSPSILEVCEGDLNMNNVLRRVIVDHANKAVSAIFTKLETFKIEDPDVFAATVIENITTLIKESLVFAKVWDDFLPMGDYGILFANACIYSFKVNVDRTISRPLDICKVMPAAHKLRLLQREIETSRLFKAQSERQSEELLQVLKFSFAHGGIVGRELLAEHSDIMSAIGMESLDKRLVALKEMITRGMKTEDWTPLGSQNHTRAVVDMVTVLHATTNAILSLNIPLENLLLPITGALEGVLNHYFLCVAGPKVNEYLTHVDTKLREDNLQSIAETVSKFGGPQTLDQYCLRMANMIYLCNRLIDSQDSIVQYYHRVLTERYEDSEEVHANLDTDLYRDSTNFFSFSFDTFQSMKELALVPASKRLIQRQCEWHLKALAKMCTLRTLLPVISHLYQPTISRGQRVADILDNIKNVCAEFQKLGEPGATAINAVYKTVFRCLMCRIHTARRYPQESTLLREDIEALKKAASEHQQDINELVSLALELIN